MRVAASIIGLLLIVGIVWALSGVSFGGVRTFYIASEAMDPTLNKDDRFVAAMGPPKDLRRGDIVLARTSDGDIYVKRLAALPGDRIALVKGVVSINGQAADLVPAGTIRVSYPDMPVTSARLFREQLPGEASAHLIQDLGATSEDDMPEATVAAGHAFLLGDNRDDSADSRVPKSIGGLEQVPLEDVVGRPLFFYWPPNQFGRRSDEGRPK